MSEQHEHDDQPPTELDDEKFRESLNGLLNHIMEHIKEEQGDAPPMRTFPDDMKMGALPDDLTEAESRALFGSPYDQSTLKIRELLGQITGSDHAFQHVLSHVPDILDPVGGGPVAEDTIAEARVKGIVVDVVTVGLLAHQVLSMIGVNFMAVKASDLLNGKGPFGD